MANPECHLLTVTGAGGSGKTRLAIEAARTAASTFLHGAVFVGLQPLSKSDLLVPTIAHAVGLSFYGSDDPQAQLLHYLREKSLLLLLDNFEHLLDDAALVSEILTHAPGIKIVITSREALNLQEEWLYPLKGMSLPPSVYSTALEDYEAVRLFLYHARRIQPNFDLADQREAVIRICKIAEGLPLAIELAASWLKGLSAPQIADEIQHNLDFLATNARNVEERHRSVRAVFDQSWKLLSEAERQTFAKLSVFRGGFDHEAAQQIAGAALPMLAALVEKSLLGGRAEGRFDMHELLRQYSAEHLERSGLADATSEAHSLYYADFLNRLASDLKSERQRDALNALSADFENVRAAWDWAVQEHRAEILSSALDGLFFFYELESQLQEGDELLAVAAEAVTDDDTLRCRLLADQASLKISRGQYDTACRLLEESIALAQALGATEQIAYGLNRLALATCYLGDSAAADRFCQQSLSLYEGLGDEWGQARCLHGLGYILQRSGDFKASQGWYRRSVRLFRELGDTHYLNVSLTNLGVITYTLGEYGEARLILEESLEIAQLIGHKLEIARAFDHLGMVQFWGMKDYAAATAYYEQSLGLHREIGDLPGVAFTLNSFGDIAYKSGDFARAETLYSEALSLFQRQNDPWNTAIVVGGLGDVTTALGQYETALGYFRTAMQMSIDIQAKALALALLISVAILFRKIEKVELSATLLTIIIHHPDAPPGLKGVARESLADTDPAALLLPDALLDDKIQAATFVNRHIDELAQNLALSIVDLSDLASLPRSANPSPQLIEPLTERELEVLQLLATGLTNPQIAEQFVIGVGTVKTHTLNIYRKLEVGNRTQAILRAQELGLL